MSPQSPAALLVSTSPDVMRLPHPLRVPAANPELFALFGPDFFGPYLWAALSKAMRDDSQMTSEIVRELAADPKNERIRVFMTTSASAPGGSALGHSLTTMQAVRHTISPQPFFVIDDHLCELLTHTDLGADIPVSELRLPYGRCYIEFGRSRTLPLYILNEMSGLHVLEGAYCETGHDENGNPAISFMLTGSPLGKENALDDATFGLFLPLDRPERSLADVAAASAEESDRISAAQGWRTGSSEALNQTQDCILMLVKALLYIGLPNVRTSVHPERTQAQKSAMAKKSPAKREKALKHAAKLTDYVLISAPAQHEAMVSREGRSPRAHWRRGHCRMQAYGEGRAQRKMVFVAPTLVNANNLDAAAPTPSYLVR